MVEEGPAVDPDAVAPFSLDEMVAKYRHQGGAGALGQPPIAYTEGRCVGGSTEVNSGLWHRLPTELTEQWRRTYAIDEFGSEVLDAHAATVEDEIGVSTLPGPPPPVIGHPRRRRHQAGLALHGVPPGVPLRRPGTRHQADHGPHLPAPGGRGGRPDPAGLPGTAVGAQRTMDRRGPGPARTARRPAGTGPPGARRGRGLWRRHPLPRAAPAIRHLEGHRTRPEAATPRSRSRRGSRSRWITTTSPCTASPSSPPTSPSVGPPAAAVTWPWPWPRPPCPPPRPWPTGATCASTTPPSAARVRARWWPCPVWALRW